MPLTGNAGDTFVEGVEDLFGGRCPGERSWVDVSAADVVFQRDNTFADAAFERLIDIASCRAKLHTGLGRDRAVHVTEPADIRVGVEASQKTPVVHRASIKTLAMPAPCLSRRGDQCGQFSQNLGARSIEFNAARIKQWAAGDGHVGRRRRRGAAASVDGPARLTR